MLRIPPDWGTFFALVVSFLVFWFIFKRLLFEPFLKLIAAREGRLTALSERTAQLLRESEAGEERRRLELAALRGELLTEREAERRRSEEDANQLAQEAREAARSTLEAVGGEIERQVRTAEAQLSAVAENLALELAERVLGRPLKGAAQVDSNS
jgi:F-type H+-transporting ATPase subunit b